MSRGAMCGKTYPFQRGGASASSPAPPALPIPTAGLLVWLKADAITGKVNGASLPTWIDSSGNGYDFAQDAGGGQTAPTYRTGSQNGLPTVRFNATAGGLTGPAGATISAQGFHAFVVCAQVGAGSVHRQHFRGKAGGWFMGHYNNQHAIAPLARFSAGATTPGLFETWEGRSPVAGNATLRVNDVQLVSVAQTGTPGQLALGFYSNFAFDPGDCDISEVIAYNAVLSAGDITTVLDYLRTKYAHY